MARTQFAIIYSTGSKIIRRIVVPTLDDSELATHALGAGESWMLSSLSRPYDLISCRALVQTETGVAPPSGRCAVLDASGNVIGICHADPAIDTPPLNCSLVAHDHAAIGDKYVAGSLQRQFAEVSTLTNTVTALVFHPLSALGEVTSVLALNTVLRPAAGKIVGQVLIPKAGTPSVLV